MFTLSIAVSDACVRCIIRRRCIAFRAMSSISLNSPLRVVLADLISVLARIESDELIESVDDLQKKIFSFQKMIFEAWR